MSKDGEEGKEQPTTPPIRFLATYSSIFFTVAGVAVYWAVKEPGPEPILAALLVLIGLPAPLWIKGIRDRVPRRLDIPFTIIIVALFFGILYYLEVQPNLELEPEAQSCDQAFQVRETNTAKVIPDAHLYYAGAPPREVISDQNGIAAISIPCTVTRVRIVVEANGYQRLEQYVKPSSATDKFCQVFSSEIIWQNNFVRLLEWNLI